MTNEPDREASLPLDTGSAAMAVKDGAYLKEGERRTVTVLFSDMKGFTSLSEGRDPEDMDSLMTRVFSRFEDLVRRHGGSVEKYIGDAMVAVFGFPDLHEDDAARALDTALEMTALTQRPGADFPQGVQFRTGIHTGLVTTGKRGKYDVVTGHTMAIASRLQTAAPVNGVLVSKDVKDACERAFVFGDEQLLSVKGKEGEVRAYQVIARRKAGFDYRTPFVDRKQPLELLTAEYLRHMRGESRAVYITGDGGMGKTRLAAEFWARLKAFPDFRATFLAINPSAAGSSDYGAVLHGAADFLDLRTDASYEEFERAVHVRTGLADDYLKDAYGLWRPAERPSQESRFAAAVSALYDAILAADGDLYPDVIFLDNASATDSRSLEFFQGWFSVARLKPFVILCDRQPADFAAAAFGITTRLVLEPLPEVDARKLIDALAPEGLDAAAKDLIIERSQGYPLFIEEYVKLILASKDADGVPQSIQTTILAALDRLEPADRALAQQLSILRLPFSAQLATALRAGAEGQKAVEQALEENLARLTAQGVLAGASGGLWAFKHGIVREAVYSSLLHHNRRVLHGLAAGLLATTDNPAEVFYHLTASENWAEARAFLVRERPHLSLDYLPLIQNLIDHCPQERASELIELHFVKYATRFNNKCYEGLKDTVMDMYRLALASRNRFFLARCYHLLMTAYYMELDYPTAALYGRKALDAYEGAGNEKGATNARYFLCSCLMAMNELKGAQKYLAELAQGDEYSREMHTLVSASLYRVMGDHVAARQANAELIARAIAQADEDEAQKRRAVQASDALKDFTFDELDPSSAPDRLFGGFDPDLATAYHGALGLARRLAGERDAAAKAFASAAYHLAQARTDPVRAQAGAQLAWARLLAGDLKEAKETALAALEAGTRCKAFSAMFQAGLVLAEAALMEGNREEFAFFVRDAALLLKAPAYRERQALARFWYFAWLFLESCCSDEASCPSDEALATGSVLVRAEREAYLAEARTLLDAELEALPTDAARERCLQLSVFGRIERS